jgi:hypothetical protein
MAILDRFNPNQRDLCASAEKLSIKAMAAAGAFGLKPLMK